MPNAASLDEATLRAQVAACGDVDSVRICAPKKSGARSKSAIIVFRSASSVLSCVQLFADSQLWAAHALAPSVSAAPNTASINERPGAARVEIDGARRHYLSCCALPIVLGYSRK